MNKGAPRDPLEVEEYLWKDAHGQVGYDVGANMGQSVDKMVQRFGFVAAFEPAAESFAVLQNDWGTNNNVRCFDMALTDHSGTLELSIRRAPIFTGQLVAKDMPYHGENLDQPAVAHWGDEVGTRRIRCETLDWMVTQIGKAPDFVKIDTEGHELQVLNGATGTMELHKPRFLIEFHTSDLRLGCIRLLEEHGYEVEVVRHPHYPEGTYMYDMHGWLRAAVPAKEEASNGEGH